ncbi:MAG: restriction endonuclease subunit S [Rubrivivax sp.]|nr:restriction endonuclease subunit S [Rubrivivax sp.]
MSPMPAAMSRDYLMLWLQSDLFVGTIDPGRSNGVPHISTKQIASMVVGLPPLAEQSRIVARVEELQHLCTALRQRLAAIQTTQSHLAEALVKQAAA